MILGVIAHLSTAVFSFRSLDLILRFWLFRAEAGPLFASGGVSGLWGCFVGLVDFRNIGKLRQPLLCIVSTIVSPYPSLWNVFHSKVVLSECHQTLQRIESSRWCNRKRPLDIDTRKRLTLRICCILETTMVRATKVSVICTYSNLILYDHLF
jgi:hypothetical protein